MARDMPGNDAHPVIIIGGGPVGLSASILLSLRGISNILFERHPGTSIHPKACGINQRTTEIFRVMGIEEEVYTHSAPKEIAGATAWYTSYGPQGREIFSRSAWGGGEDEAEYATFSPSRYCIVPQIRLEPILKRKAEELNPDGILFYHEVVSISDHETCPTVTVKNRNTGESQDYRSLYLIVADGGRMFTKELGAEWSGEPDILNMNSAHIRAPIRPHQPDKRIWMTWFTNPEMGGSTRTGYLYQLGPWPEAMTNPDVEEWMFACASTEDDPPKFDENTILTRLRKTIGIPDLKIELLSLSHWTVNAIYASKWRMGRTFLVGDSAHRIPPWGALGMNSGIQDVQNLIWKLALALKDPVQYYALLDTYETERYEIGKRVGQSSLNNMRSHSAKIDQAIGISARQTRAENVAAAESFFNKDDPDYAHKRAAIAAASKDLDTEFKAPGYEVGWYYPSADINAEGGATHGGQQLPDGTLVHDKYFINTIPGHHLPHAWLELGDKSLAIRDLLDMNLLTLFVENDQIVIRDPRVQVVVVGGPIGWKDTTGQWQKYRGVDSSGGVLVRPDGIVAWRGVVEGVDEQSFVTLVNTILKAGA
ncbi:hypothetical protein AC579_9223 [Pseudocercospora musae]|uniref:FAD-binding domain-containing protein n=1 Tax=Pseudocercospora musae TaxID=113226 RepID=A0A139I1B8_9PEZI|nr:hypothetical protein AC579_9223 [Pseudocercospora musae]